MALCFVVSHIFFPSLLRKDFIKDQSKYIPSHWQLEDKLTKENLKKYPYTLEDQYLVVFGIEWQLLAYFSSNFSKDGFSEEHDFPGLNQRLEKP